MENILGINWHSESVSGYPSKNAAITKVVVAIDAGCSLGIGDRKILRLLHRILRLKFNSVWLFDYNFLMELEGSLKEIKTKNTLKMDNIMMLNYGV